MPYQSINREHFVFKRIKVLNWKHVVRMCLTKIKQRQIHTHRLTFVLFYFFIFALFLHWLVNMTHTKVLPSNQLCNSNSVFNIFHFSSSNIVLLELCSECNLHYVSSN